ncbi:MAG: SdiA-regulated domain-containing protein [Bacteroidota bacterium]
MKIVPLFISMMIVQFTSTSCSEPAASNNNPPNYDLSKPVMYKMPPVLDEISGIAFSHGNTDTIFAEQDEEGKLFYFHLGDTEIRHSKFSKRGDYEDVAICNGQVIMLRSDGIFYTFPLNEIVNKVSGNTKEQAGLLPAGEYESMYADEATNTIYTLCKNCSDDKSSQSVTGHTFAIGTDGRMLLKNQFSFNEQPIAILAGKGKLTLKPSALARNPITQQWYILSSVNKMLVITDGQWKPIAVYPLNPALFTQPEGIAFDKTGNMYISNEKGSGANGTILKFLRQKK